MIRKSERFKDTARSEGAKESRATRVFRDFVRLLARLDHPRKIAEGSR